MNDSDDTSNMDFIREHVRTSADALITSLADAWSRGGGSGLRELCIQAEALASPVPDYESAAREAGWTQAAYSTVWEKGGVRHLWTAQELCVAEGIEAHHRDVYEHWIVSDWLVARLEAKGERVDHDFAGWNVWARAETAPDYEAVARSYGWRETLSGWKKAGGEYALTAERVCRDHEGLFYLHRPTLVQDSVLKAILADHEREQESEPSAPQM